MKAEWMEYFQPELRARKKKAAAMALEAERRRRQAELEAEVGAIASSPVIQGYRTTLLAWGEALAPGNDMDAAACFWFRKGLEQAVRRLDEHLAAAQKDSE